MEQRPSAHRVATCSGWWIVHRTSFTAQASAFPFPYYASRTQCNMNLPPAWLARIPRARVEPDYQNSLGRLSDRDPYLSTFFKNH
ncbi:hypothetical protein B0H12DRAFT_1126823 [Mycena haematopus]|nr:hypothetical protein B0H12DRAFT_1126823 [Mycena haematopus]